MFCEKDVLTNFEKFTTNYLCWIHIFIEVADLQRATLSKKETLIQEFFVIFAKDLRGSFIENTEIFRTKSNIYDRAFLRK